MCMFLFLVLYINSFICSIKSMLVLNKLIENNWMLKLMQATLYLAFKSYSVFFFENTVNGNLLYFFIHYYSMNKDKFFKILLENIAGCQQSFRSSDSRLSADFWSSDSRLSLDLKVCWQPAVTRPRHLTKQSIDWLSWGLTTRQPLWVILCRLPEKGRK